MTQPLPRRTLILTAAAALAASPALGQSRSQSRNQSRGRAPRPAMPARAPLPAYDGLLPPGFQMEVRHQDLDPAALRDTAAAIIPSLNFVAQANQMQEWRGRSPNGFAGHTSDRMNALYNEFEPRVFSDALTAALTPRFRSILSAPDLPSARDAGARCFVIADLWVRVHPFTHRVETRAGVRILDQGLSELFAAEHHHMQLPPGNPLFSSPSTDQHFDNTARLYRLSMAGAMGPVMSALDTAFRA